MAAPLAGLRVVTTMPPHTWFGGVDYNFAVEMSEELRALGAEVVGLDVAAFNCRNERYIGDAIAKLRAFRPDVALALPNALYSLLCMTPKQENVFIDILQIPTLLLWDHGLLQLPKQILAPLPSTPAEASAGAIRRLRKILNHPLYFHYSPDRGHIDAMHKLGIIDRRKVHFFLQPAYPNYVRHGYRTVPGGSFRTRIAFAGNVYLQAARTLPFREEPVFEGIEKRVLTAKKSRLNECLWDLILGEIGALDGGTRRRLGLDADSTFFWNFLHEEIETVGNTDVRLSVLTGLEREYDFYGNFVEPASVNTLRDRYRVRFRKCLDYFTELPLLFMNSDLIVDVINLGYNTGISPKVMGCFASGGMVLFDYKDDFYQGMGEAGDQVMYRSVEHLNRMVDEYLGNPRRRRDVGRFLQHRAATEYSWAALGKKILADEAVWKR
jgi:hypothetical protein